ncbi:MAG: glycosyltransferase [Desulfocapsaceae bacterium]|nr:glycosyltransferase [Desulfocapsaceae bacterium]
MPTVLWWGRTERDYSRNRVVLHLFENLGWDISSFHPFSSQLGLLEAVVRRPRRPDLVWLPCFRHRDIHSAAFWARKWQVPLVLDPLISAYEKEVFERRKWPSDSRQAEHLRRWETKLFATADVLVADTSAHARFFHERLQVKPENTRVLYVGAEDGLFEARPAVNTGPPYELLFYGSFLELHGVDVIVKAAKILNRPDVTWVLLGEGDMKEGIQAEASRYPFIRFESWIPYETLPDRIARAHIMLGIFGPTVLTDLVIPNKMFQSMAVGRPVITSYSKAYTDSLEGSDIIGWVPSGDPQALADKVDNWLRHPDDLDRRGQETRALFDAYFSPVQLQTALQEIIVQAMHNRR